MLLLTHGGCGRIHLARHIIESQRRFRSGTLAYVTKFVLRKLALIK